LNSNWQILVMVDVHNLPLLAHAMEEAGFEEPFKGHRRPSVVSIEESLRLIDPEQAFENTSTSVAASQMRNALNDLVGTIQDEDAKEVSRPTMI
jgi:hypothetical protein